MNYSICSNYHERGILKLFILTSLYKAFNETFQNKMQFDQSNYLEERYAMDSKMMQFLLQSIVETGEYTLEGIAHYTQISFDAIFDAACGINNQLSITSWVKIVELYLQVKPDVAKILRDKVGELKEKNDKCIDLLLNRF